MSPMSDGGLSAAAVDFGRTLLDWVGGMNVATGAILCAVLLLDRLLERWISASVRLVLCAAVGARLFLPASWRSPLGLLGGSPPPEFAPAMEDPISVVTMLPLEPTTSSWDTSGWATIVYATIAVALLGWWTYSRLALRAQLRSVESVDNWVGRIPVVKHPEIGPMVAGLLRPRIVVPSALLESSRAEALAWVLRHEAAHVQRRDPLLGAFVQIVCILAWPILPVWIAARRVRALMEIACDERAVAGADGPARRRYGETLLALAEDATLRKAFGPVLTFGSPLRGRLRALTPRHRWPIAAQTVTVAAAATLTVACAGEPEWADPSPDPSDAAYSDTNDALDLEPQIASPAVGSSERGIPRGAPSGPGLNAWSQSVDPAKAVMSARVGSDPSITIHDPGSGPARDRGPPEFRPAGARSARPSSAPIVNIAANGTLWLRTRRGGSTRLNDLHGLERSLSAVLRTSGSRTVLIQAARHAPESVIKDVQLVARRAGATDLGLWTWDNVMFITGTKEKRVWRRPADPVLTITAAGSLFMYDQPVAIESLEETLRVALSRQDMDTLLLRGHTEDKVVPNLMAIAKRAGAKNVGILREPSPQPQVILTVTKDGHTFVNKLRVTPESLEDELRRAMANARTTWVFLHLDQSASHPRVVDIMHTAKLAGATTFGILPGPPVVIPGTASVRGNLDKEAIRRVVRPRIAWLRSCYERELRNRPSFGGHLTIQFQIDPKGLVEVAEVQRSTLGAPSVEDCIEKLVKGWRFPLPEDGTAVVVKQPFKFVPTGGL